ncbi:response regulator [Polaromonas sp. CG_9.11]|uniref:response regulator n=1 Tax=Polaromonas sp. CG_9.11 TaxID=2787730 RepID=UPI0018CB58A7|nr:response regulator [Polaromonas sp. CG_9.11]MBG6077919.1 DNA-binding NarL/FixJ family response regulator [Polaromonas sp. CG_9.11]
MQTLIAYLVEDNPTVRTNLIETLGEIAQLKITAHSATQQEASQWLGRHSEWHLAIIDLFLKQGSGLGVLAACRQRASFQKVVILTNYATPEIRMRSAALGADAVFDKSTELDGLMDYCIEQTRKLAGRRHDASGHGSLPT